jgi:hypothetical protein
MMNGCTRIATTGMSALATAQTVARATGNQVQVMEMLQGGQGLDREPGGGHRDAARHPCAEDRRIRSQPADLPETLSNYLLLPPGFTRIARLDGGRNANTLLLEQLTLLDASLRRIAEDALRDDAEALVVHGKFLQERFGPVTFVGDTVPQALPGERS